MKNKLKMSLTNSIKISNSLATQPPLENLWFSSFISTTYQNNFTIYQSVHRNVILGFSNIAIIAYFIRTIYFILLNYNLLLIINSAIQIIISLLLNLSILKALLKFIQSLSIISLLFSVTYLTLIGFIQFNFLNKLILLSYFLFDLLIHFQYFKFNQMMKNVSTNFENYSTSATYNVFGQQVLNQYTKQIQNEKIIEDNESKEESGEKQVHAQVEKEDLFKDANNEEEEQDQSPDKDESPDKEEYSQILQKEINRKIQLDHIEMEEN